MRAAARGRRGGPRGLAARRARGARAPRVRREGDQPAVRRGAGRAGVPRPARTRAHPRPKLPRVAGPVLLGALAGLARERGLQRVPLRLAAQHHLPPGPVRPAGAGDRVPHVRRAAGVAERRAALVLAGRGGGAGHRRVRLAATDGRRRWRSVVPWAVLGVLAAELAGLALWYSPFGWIGWGPRLTLPLVPPLLVLAVAFAGTGGAQLLGRLLRGRGIWLAGAAVAVAGVTQLAFLDPQPVLRRFFRLGGLVRAPADRRSIHPRTTAASSTWPGGVGRAARRAAAGGHAARSRRHASRWWDGGGTARDRSPARRGRGRSQEDRPTLARHARPAALTPIPPSPFWSTASGRATAGRWPGPSRSSSRRRADHRAAGRRAGRRGPARARAAASASASAARPASASPPSSRRSGST